VNHTTSTLLAAIAVMTAVASGVFSTTEPLQNAGAADGCHTDNNNGTSTCSDKHTDTSDNKIELFFQSIDSDNNTKTNTVMASQKDMPFILPFP
jgi:Spy/CpxP family protein refolding chaperone